eukprot:11140513-Prorocentrum_lima.AAC.1
MPRRAASRPCSALLSPGQAHPIDDISDNVRGSHRFESSIECAIPGKRSAEVGLCGNSARRYKQ